MALEIYRFPMSHGVVVDGGKNFLGLVRSEGEAAFVLYDLEKNDIIYKLRYMDTTDWKLNKQLEDHPAGVSDKGAYFVSDWVLSEEQGENFRKPCGMEVRAYGKDTGELLDTIPVSDGIRDWPVNCRLLDMAMLEDQFYLVIYSEKMRSERDFVIALYDAQNGESSELWRSAGHQARYFDTDFHPDTLTITVKRADEFFYDVFDRNNYDFFTLQLSEDYGRVELAGEEKVSLGEECEIVLPGLSKVTQKRGFLRGRQHQFVDESTGRVLLEMKEGMNTVLEYVVIPGLSCVIVEKSGVMGSGASYYVIEQTEDGFRLTHSLEMSTGARISYDEEAGWAAIVANDESCVLRR